jgi:transcriptional/translational regulatory protein YebC/TACO1
VRHAFSKHGGSLGEPGSVAYLFDKKGVIVVDAAAYGEDDLMVAIDAGAEDVVDDDGTFRVLTAPGDLNAVRAGLEDAGIGIDSADVVMDPKNTVEVGEGEAKTLLNLIEALDDHDDVDAVHANFDMSAEVMEKALG